MAVHKNYRMVIFEECVNRSELLVHNSRNSIGYFPLCCAGVPVAGFIIAHKTDFCTEPVINYLHQFHGK